MQTQAVCEILKGSCNTHAIHSFLFLDHYFVFWGINRTYLFILLERFSSDLFNIYASAEGEKLKFYSTFRILNSAVLSGKAANQMR